MATYGYQPSWQSEGADDLSRYGGGWHGIGQRSRALLGELGEYGRGQFNQLGQDFGRDYRANPFLLQNRSLADDYNEQRQALLNRPFQSGDPSFDFRRDQALAAHNNRYASRGGALSGAARIGAQNLASAMAGTEYAADYNRRVGALDSGFGARRQAILGQAGNYSRGTLGDYQMRQAGLGHYLGAQQAGIAELTRAASSAQAAHDARAAARKARNMGLLRTFAGMGLGAAAGYAGGLGGLGVGDGWGGALGGAALGGGFLGGFGQYPDINQRQQDLYGGDPYRQQAHDLLLGNTGGYTGRDILNDPYVYQGAR